VHQQLHAVQTDTQQWQARHAEATSALAALQEQRTAMAADVARGQTLSEQATQRATAAEQHNVHLHTQLQTALLEQQHLQGRATEERALLHQQLDMRQEELERLRHSADNAQQTLVETRTAWENVQEQFQQARHAAQQEQARHAETAQALTAVRTQLEVQAAQAAQERERIQTQSTQAMQQRDALQAQLSHLADAVQQHEQTLVSQREALQRATVAAEAAQQQLQAQADQEAKRTAGLQALQQHVSQELATAIAQKVVTLQPAPDRLTLRVRSETLFRPGTGALRPESRDILEQIAAVLHTFPDYLCRVDGHTDNAPMTGAARERFPSTWEFSAVRAVTLGRFFQERKIPAERLVASGHAFYRPLAPNTTPEGRAQNRRIEISLVPLPVPEDGQSADTNGRHTQ
jgi:chemotaxis protein MotB